MKRPPKNPEVIDVGPRKRTRLKIWIIAGAILVLVLLSRVVSIYISALWFESLGYSSVYWYVFKPKLALFAISAILTALLLAATFTLFQKLFGAYAFESRTILLNNQPFTFSPAKIIRPVGWLIAAFFGLLYGFTLKENWRQFALFWNQPSNAANDPIFGKSLGFYLFSLPLYDVLSSWLLGVTFVILVAAVAYSLLDVGAAQISIRKRNEYTAIAADLLDGTHDPLRKGPMPRYNRARFWSG